MGGIVIGVEDGICRGFGFMDIERGIDVGIFVGILFFNLIKEILY